MRNGCSALLGSVTSRSGCGRAAPAAAVAVKASELISRD